MPRQNIKERKKIVAVVNIEQHWKETSAQRYLPKLSSCKR